MSITDVLGTPHPEDFKHLQEQAYLEKLTKLIKLDPHVNPDEKIKLLSFLEGPDPIGHLLAGTAGAYIAHSLSKFLGLKKETQILLSLAGFGAGVMLSNAIGHSDKVVQEHGKTKIVI